MRCLAAFFALTVLAPVSISVAQNKKPASDADTKKSQQLFDEAFKHFQLREYAEAIPLLKEAYRLYPAPLFLYNLAQCHLELKQYEEAVAYFENFIDVDPKSKNRNQAEKYLKTAREGLAAEQERKQKEAAEKAEQERLQKMLELEKAKKEQAAAKQDGPRFYTKPWFWGVVGGAAVAGTGTAIGVSIAKSIPNTDLGNQDILDK